MAKVADMFKEGQTAEQVAQAIKAEGSVEEPTTSTVEEIGQSMREQDISTSKSLASDLTLDYMQGNITDEQYSAVFKALTK